MDAKRLQKIDVMILSCLSSQPHTLWSLCAKLKFLKSARQRTVIQSRLDVLVAEGRVLCRKTEKGHNEYYME